MRLPITAAMLLVAPLAHAEIRVDRIDVLDAGIFVVETGEATADPSAPMGETVAVTKSTLVEATDTIPGKLGTNFGYSYRVVGEPAGEKAPLDFAVTYPEPGLADPEADEPIREVRFTREKTVGEADYLGYEFEAPWEVVPGTWTFEIWFEGRKLAERSFTVTAGD